MAWIESHTTLARHPKTLRLARQLGLSVPCVLGHLHLLWWWAIEYAEDGDLSKYDAEEIALACMWEGEPDVFLAALRRAGFVDDAGAIHDWYEYAGKLVDRRRANAERMREARHGARAENVPSINSERATHVQDTFGARAGATVPNQPNQTKPTEPTKEPAPDASAPAVRSAPKPNKSGELLDLVKAGDVPIAMTPADHSALKNSALSAAQVAEVYLALARGEHGTEWQQDNLSVSVAIKAWAGYETAKQGRRSPPRTNGRPTQDHVSSLQRLVAREEQKAHGTQDVRGGNAATVRHLLAQERPTARAT